MKKLTLPLFILLTASFLWWAFHPAEITTKIKGKVYHTNIGLSNVEVSVLNQENQSIGYYEPTNQLGLYSLRFNAVEGYPMNLKFQKKYFSTLITEYIPLRDSLPYNFKDIHLIKLVHETKIAQSVRNHTIDIYTSLTTAEKEIYNINDIKYFTFIEKATVHPFLPNNVKKGTWYEVSFYLNNQVNNKIIGWFFEKSNQSIDNKAAD